MIFLTLGQVNLQEDIQKVAPEERAYIRYLSLHNLSDNDKEDYIHLSSFVFNSLSKSKTITKPVVVDKNHIRVNLKDFKITTEAWDNFAKKHPYGKVMRVDWFIVNAMKAPDYYNLLGVKDIDDIHKLTGAAKDAQFRAIVTSSEIARSTRVIERKATLQGNGVWYSYENNDDRNFINNLLSEEFETQELIASLPNELLTYFVGDKKGKLLDVVNPSIAVYNKGMIRSAQTCIMCHTNGVMKFTDTVRSLFSKNVTITTSVKNDVDKIIALFGGDLKIIQRDQDSYRAAIVDLTGMTSESLHKLYAKAVDKYDSPLDINTAASEMNMSNREFLTWVESSNNAYLLHLRSHPIRRDQWEHIFKSKR